jgi:hypothetical protein
MRVPGKGKEDSSFLQKRSKKLLSIKQNYLSPSRNSLATKRVDGVGIVSPSSVSRAGNSPRFSCKAASSISTPSALTRGGVTSGLGN